MSYDTFTTLDYDDLGCYIMEQIDQNQLSEETSKKISKKISEKNSEEISKEISERISWLRDVGFMHKSALCLTQKGRDHLYEAINCAREENRSAVEYTGILTGFTIAFFGLLVGGVNIKAPFALLLTYVLCFLFVSVLASMLGGFCFWHGCSREHGWEELRVLNEMGDSLVTFSGWILLYTVYLALFLNLSQAKFPIEIPSYGSTIYFLIPTAVSLGWVYFSRRAYKRGRGKVRPENFKKAIYDFVNTTTFLFFGGRKFYQINKEGRGLGWIILIMLSIVSSAFPIILLTLSV